jgi:hypothetical protein
MTELLRNVPPGQNEILAGNYEDLRQRQQELLAAANRAPKTCDDDETARKLTDFVGQIGSCITVAIKAHKIEKEPWLQGSRIVDGFFRDVREPLEIFKRTFERLIGDWQQRKQEAERLAALEAERLAREEMERLAAAAETDADLEDAIAQEDAALEQAAIAAARPLERSRVHGDLATGSLTTDYEYEPIDMAKVPLKFLMLDDSAIKRHIRSRPKDGEPEPIPGLHFTPIYSARIRTA